MRVTADLHTHSTSSDGDLAPGKLVEMAAARGLTAISLTDHDTLIGVSQALESGNRLAVRVIPGVEISAEYEPGMLHILGYFRACPEGLEVDLERVQAARRERLPRIIRKLNDQGIMLTKEDVMEMAGDSQIGRPHIAKALLGKGYVGSFDEAFHEYLGKGKKAYVPKEKMTWEKAIDLILHHGGLPVLAHPSTLGLDGADLGRFIQELSQAGLKGIEVHYPNHTPEHISQFLHAAQESRLLITGGTDFHGPHRNSVSIGDHGIDSTLLGSFCERLMASGGQLTSLVST